MPGGISPPPEVLASWPKPNYINPETRGWNLVIACSILSFFSILIVGLRLYTRLVVTKNFGIDDTLMIVATIISIGMAVAICLASKVYYFDRHVYDIPYPSGLYETRKITFALELLYLYAVGFIKISILFFYRRLGKGILSKIGTSIIYALIASVIAFMITFTFTLFFQCRPFNAYWLQVNIVWSHTHKHTCTSDYTTLMAASIASVVQDFLVAGLPTIMFVRMDIPFRQKLAMAAVFAVGFFLCVAGLLRIVYVHQIFNETYDVTWAGNDAWLWTAIEVLLGTIVGSLPALKVFVQRHLQSVRSHYYGRSAGEDSRRGPSRMSAGINWISGKGNRRMSQNNAWAWQRTPSNVENGDIHEDDRHGRPIPLKHVENVSSQQTDGRETPIEHARRITEADCSIYGNDNRREPDFEAQRRQQARRALNSHPISPTSLSFKQQFTPGRFPEEKGGTWLSDHASGYTASVTASGSYDGTEGKGGFDPDAHALPILTEQESRDMGFIGTAH